MKQTQFGSNSHTKKILEPLVYDRCWKVWNKPVNMIKEGNTGHHEDGQGAPHPLSPNKG